MKIGGALGFHGAPPLCRAGTGPRSTKFAFYLTALAKQAAVLWRDPLLEATIMCSIAHWFVSLAVALAIGLPAVAQARGGSGGAGRGGAGHPGNFGFHNVSPRLGATWSPGSPFVFRNHSAAFGRSFYRYGYGYPPHGYGYYAYGCYNCGGSTTAGPVVTPVPTIGLQIVPAGGSGAGDNRSDPVSPQVWHRDEGGTWHEVSAGNSAGSLR
jgi:hypothetical protein